MDISKESYAAIIDMQQRQWLELKASLMLELQVQNTIAAELKIDKSSIISTIEARMKECILALQILDKKLKELV